MALWAAFLTWGTKPCASHKWKCYLLKAENTLWCRKMWIVEFIVNANLGLEMHMGSEREQKHYWLTCAHASKAKLSISFQHTKRKQTCLSWNNIWIMSSDQTKEKRFYTESLGQSLSLICMEVMYLHFSTICFHANAHLVKKQVNEIKRKMNEQLVHAVSEEQIVFDSMVLSLAGCGKSKWGRRDKSGSFGGLKALVNDMRLISGLNRLTVIKDCGCWSLLKTMCNYNIC